MRCLCVRLALCSRDDGMENANVSIVSCADGRIKFRAIIKSRKLCAASKSSDDASANFLWWIEPIAALTVFYSRSRILLLFFLCTENCLLLLLLLLTASVPCNHWMWSQKEKTVAKWERNTNYENGRNRMRYVFGSCLSKLCAASNSSDDVSATHSFACQTKEAAHNMIPLVVNIRRRKSSFFVCFFRYFRDSELSGERQRTSRFALTWGNRSDASQFKQ